MTIHHLHIWRRQLSAKRFADDNIRFCFGDENLDSCDYCVVYDDLPLPLDLPLLKSRTILVVSEPVSVKCAPKDFLEQFGTVITSDRLTPHPNHLLINPMLPWHIGMYRGINKYRRQPITIDAFRKYEPKKQKLVSVICSDKAFTEQHRNRLSFLKRLQEYFGNRIDVFGRGINTFVDKEDVLAPYRYHIVLENCNNRDYWTEKLSDTIFALTYPIYYGCKNLEDYFSDDCFTRIDITQPDQAMKIIESVITSDKDKASQNALRHARDLILDKYNIFELVAGVVQQLPPSPSENARTILYPSRRRFRRRRFRRRRFRRWLFRRWRLP